MHAHSGDCPDSASPAAHVVQAYAHLIIDGARLAAMAPDPAAVTLAAIAMEGMAGREGRSLSALLACALEYATAGDEAMAYLNLRAAAVVARANLITTLEGTRE